MTREEWIEQDLSFFHITQTSNLENIYLTGIENRNGKGICVVRTSHELIVRFICEMMLNIDGELEYSIIEIKPSIYNLKTEEILDDNVVELTNCLHNYIKREFIEVTAENIVGTYQANPLGISNLIEFENEIRYSITLERLQ